ncbi:MAG: UDP-N-acetylmuramoyl-L-alanyl-D-glutamate--2,6-diaminopimelate ligase [Halieaceae bacterium]|jgi:UDP-N-acetylmuramoyl-L-alanyl-D-glutamate--2,6-diaminopimelate ligase
MTAAEQQRETSSVTLGDLFAELRGGELASETVKGLCLDSRLVVPGDLFFACRGYTHDAREFVVEAVVNGAFAIALECDADERKAVLGRFADLAVPIFTVTDLSSKLSGIAGKFYRDPSQKLVLTGVTGTNGKTTCTQLIGQLNQALYTSGGVIGTLGASLTGAVVEAVNTTPDAISLQAQLAEWQDQSVEHVAIEVSSHALHQGRVSGLKFDAAIFTNLTRDHLDYHETMAAYGEAKSTLFRLPGLRRAILNLDDEYSAILRPQIPAGVEIYSYSVSDKSADVWASDAKYHARGVTAAIRTPWGDGLLTSPLMGEFNLSNTLAALVCLCSGGAPLVSVLAALTNLQAIPGRMESIENNCGIQVIVDYAHTPDALAQVLAATRMHSPQKLWCVFGCGGDRDRGKRAEMGGVASAVADVVVITSDNPRNENPEAVIADILQGCSGDIRVEPDRGKAIRMAVDEADSGDTIVVAGKGHETYQIVGEKRVEFSDIAIARDALSERRKQ